MGTKLARHPWTPDSDDGHADLSSHDTWVAGTPYSTFQRMRDEDPVAWVDEADGSGSVSYTHLTLPTNREV